MKDSINFMFSSVFSCPPIPMIGDAEGDTGSCCMHSGFVSQVRTLCRGNLHLKRGYLSVSPIFGLKGYGIFIILV